MFVMDGTVLCEKRGVNSQSLPKLVNGYMCGIGANLGSAAVTRPKLQIR